MSSFDLCVLGAAVLFLSWFKRPHKDARTQMSCSLLCHAVVKMNGTGVEVLRCSQGWIYGVTALLYQPYMFRRKPCVKSGKHNGWSILFAVHLRATLFKPHHVRCQVDQIKLTAAVEALSKPRLFATVHHESTPFGPAATGLDAAPERGAVVWGTKVFLFG
jgi:hypothetical protein